MTEAYDGVEGGEPVRPAGSPDAQVAAASALLEAVAVERGLVVRRLDEELVLCDDGQRRVLFHGLVSSSTGKLAYALCCNDGWLRAHLARHGLPVVPTALVGADDLGFARRVAESLGFPVRVRLVGGRGEPAESDARVASDVDSLALAWQGLGAGADGRRQVLLEVVPAGGRVQVTVVAGQATAVPSGVDGCGEQARQLAVRAVATLPGVSYGVVCLVAAEPGLVIDRIDLAPVASDAVDDAAVGGAGEGDATVRRVIDAVLTAAFGPSRR